MCPIPPRATRASALATASAKSRARYSPRVGDSFSWAKASSGPTESTSPISTWVPAGTSIPAIPAMVAADWPTMAGLSAPSTRINRRRASRPWASRMCPPWLANRARTAA